MAQHDGRVVIEALDVTDEPGIQNLAARYQGTPIDLLINNAGILGDIDAQKLGSFDFEVFDQIFDVNTKGPLRVVEAFIDNVAASEQKKIINISSAVGSIKMTFGGQNFYRTSKAALNMSMRTLAKEMRRAKEPGRKELLFGLIDPGRRGHRVCQECTHSDDPGRRIGERRDCPDRWLGQAKEREVFLLYRQGNALVNLI